MITDTSYDVFVSYDSRDRPFVKEVVEELEKRKCSCFFDQRHLRKGFDWVMGLEEALEASRSVAVFLGPHGMGGWQQRERAWALDRQIHHPDYPVIPAVLPDSDPPRDFMKLLTWVEFRAGPREAAQLDCLAAAIRGESVQQLGLQDPRTSVCPYRGLQYFREEDASFFFGRDKYTDKLVEMVGERTLAAVIGDSGSGKSSVVRAGLVPRLRLPGGGPVWEIVTMVPGEDPLHALADVILPLIEPDLAGVHLVRKRTEVAEDLRHSRMPLWDLAAEVLRQQKGTDRLLLVVDQWEELYTLCDDSQLRHRFVDELLEATARKQTPLSVALTLRADFYRELVQDRALLDQLEGGQLNLGPMNREELQAAIEKPAANVGLTFQDGLVERLLEDARDEPGRLPLLEFALEELWKRQSGGQLTHSAYEDLGRLSGAIATRAETIYASLDAAQQAAVPGLVRRLVRAGEKTNDDTRRRADFRSLSETSQRVARLFADKRLLVTTFGSRSASVASAAQTEGDSAVARGEADQPDSTGDAIATETVEVAHRRGLRRWGRLKQWVDKDRKFLQWRARLAPLLEQYHRDAKSALLRHGALSEARQFYTARTEELEQGERSFVDASLRAELKRKQRLWGVVVATVAAMASAYLWVRMNTALTRVDGLLSAAPLGVGAELEKLRAYRWFATKPLHDACNNQDLGFLQRLHAAFGIAEFDTLRLDELELLLGGIPRVDAAERANYFRALQLVRPPPIDALLRLAKAAKSPPAKRRYAMTLLSFGRADAAKQMAALAEDPSSRTELIHNWEEWPPELGHLAPTTASREQRRRIPFGRLLPLGRLGKNQDTLALETDLSKELVKALGELHRTARSGGTHSAADWALRQWQSRPTKPKMCSNAAEIDQETGQHDWYQNSLGMTMVKVPKGEFQMGSGDDDSPASPEKPRHRVSTSAFWMGDREVTNQQFGAIVAKGRRETQSTGREGESEPLLPVTYITWFDAVAFCIELSRREESDPYYEMTNEEYEEPAPGESGGTWIVAADVEVLGGQGYRLPTEAEWEYACRARSTTQFCYGNETSMRRPERLDDYAVFDFSGGDVLSGTAESGSKMPNGWGLFGMHGNVSETCWDRWGPGYYAESPADDPPGPPTGSIRVVRGGRWCDEAWSCRSAFRTGREPSSGGGTLGFRVARSLSGRSSKSSK